LAGVVSQKREQPKGLRGELQRFAIETNRFALEINRQVLVLVAVRRGEGGLR
jgi:hypothetical protein